MKEKLWLLAVLGVACLLIVGWMANFAFANHTGEVIIINKSSERVLKGDLEICNQQFKFQDINPGESTKIFYKVKSDSHYKITVELKSGKKMVKELGYVTNGLDFKDTLIVQDDDIVLK